MYPLTLSPRAELDLDDALTWYAARSISLAARFDAAVDQTFALISEFPFRFPEFKPGVRRALLRDFPYHVMYRVLSDAYVEVLAVYHASRDPERWDQVQRD